MNSTLAPVGSGGARPVDPAAPWNGPNRRYDIVNEGLVALLVVGLLVVGLAAVFGSPDEPSVTLQQWANADAMVWGVMLLLTLGFVLVPFIAGVRDLPRWIPIHRLVWRDYHRRYGSTRR